MKLSYSRPSECRTWFHWFYWCWAGWTSNGMVDGVRICGVELEIPRSKP